MSMSQDWNRILNLVIQHPRSSCHARPSPNPSIRGSVGYNFRNFKNALTNRSMPTKNHWNKNGPGRTKHHRFVSFRCTLLGSTNEDDEDEQPPRGGPAAYWSDNQDKHVNDQNFVADDPML
jgi:hypothetical protein